MTKEIQHQMPYIHRPLFNSVTTTDDNWTNTVLTTEGTNYWDTESLNLKVLRFTATTKDLSVRILGSLDGHTTFADTVEAAFTVVVGTPVIKRIPTYWTALKVQVKTAAAGQNGTLAITAVGTTHTAEADTELTVDLPLGDQAGSAAVAVYPANNIPTTRDIGRVTLSPTDAGKTGATTDTPYVGTEDATARGIISLLKGIKNSIYGTIVAGISTTCGFNNFVSAPISLTLSTAGAYHAGDCLGGALVEIPLIALANGRGGIIDMVRVSLNEAAKTPRIRVHFFNKAPAAGVSPTIAADNALWEELAADSALRVGFMELTALASAPNASTDCSRAQDTTNRQTLRYVCAADSRSLWVGFETLDAVTITAGKAIGIVVKAEMS